MRTTANFKVIARILAATLVSLFLLWTLKQSLPQSVQIKDLVAAGAWASFDSNPLSSGSVVAVCEVTGQPCYITYDINPTIAGSIIVELTHRGMKALKASLKQQRTDAPRIEQIVMGVGEEQRQTLVFNLLACRTSACQLALEVQPNGANALDVSARYQATVAKLPAMLTVALTLLWLGAELLNSTGAFAKLFNKGLLNPVWPAAKSNLPSVRNDLIDPLTDALNRQGFELQATELIKKIPGGAALCVIDIDRFKYINDAYGRAAGDELLVAFSRRIKGAIRGSDYLARWGGEEFVVISLQANEKAAGKFAAKLCDIVAREPFQVRGSPELQLTVSIGLAQHDIKESFNGLFLRADAALFHAKQSGKNRVCIAPSEREA